MIEGKIVNNTLYVTVTVSWAQAVQEVVAALDTGFDGDLKLSEEKITELGLSVSHVQPIQLADGSRVNMQASFAYAEMEGAINSIDVLIAPGHPVVGVGLLKKFDYTLIADLKRDKMVLDARKKWV